MPQVFKRNLLSKRPTDPAPADFDLTQAADNELDPTQILLSWEAPSRPYRKRGKQFYTTVAILVVLISLIAILWQWYMLVGALLSFMFLVYVLNFVRPEDIEYKISNQGITIGEHFYHWQELDSFFFSEKDGVKVLNILTRIRFPGMLIMLLGDKKEEEVKKVVAKFLPFHEIAPKTFIDEWSEKLEKYFPLDSQN